MLAIMPSRRSDGPRLRTAMTVDNFCEWEKRRPKEKQLYAIELPDRKLMALAGLWDIWRLAGG